MRLMHKLLEALMTMILIRECNYSEFRLRGKDSLPTTGTTPSWNFHCQLKYTLIYDNIWSHSLMGNLNCCWVFLSLNGQMYIYRFCPKQCHTNEGEAYYLGLWPLGLLSEVVSLCFGGDIPPRAASFTWNLNLNWIQEQNVNISCQLPTEDKINQWRDIAWEKTNNLK